MKRVIIALDVGTSSMRAVIFNMQGAVLFTKQMEYHTIFPRPSYVEQDPLTWKEAAFYVLKPAAEFIRNNGHNLLAISVTSQRASMISMDSEGNHLHNSIMWQDKRTIDICERLISEYGLEYLYRKTGVRCNPLFVLNKIIWLRENEPELFAKAVKHIGVQDYVVYQLTGEYVTDWTQASRTMLMDLKTFRWDPELLRIAGITEDRLCRLVPPGSVAGYITKEASALCDITEGTPVIVSGGDQQNAAIGLGVVKTGIAEANTGTGSFVLSFSDKPIFNENCKVLCQASAIAGNWMAETAIFNTGAIYRWFKEQFYPEYAGEKNVYELINKDVAAVPVGSKGVIMLPHFEGSAAPYWNPRAKGLFFNLGLGTTRADLARAIQEGIALEIAENLKLMREMIGDINEVSVAGGMVKSDLFCRIQSDAYGANVLRYRNPEATALGAMMNAAVNLGVFSSFEEAVTKLFDEPEVFKADPEQTKIYDSLSNRRNVLYNALNNGGVYNEFMKGIT